MLALSILTSLLGRAGWRWLAVPAALVLALGAGLAFVHLSPPVYRADALLYVDVNANPQAVQPADGLLTPSYVQLVTSSRTLDRAAASSRLAGPGTRAELQSAISATVQKGTNTIAVSARSRDSERAALLADVAAQATVDQNRFDGQTRLKASIALLQDQLRQLDATLLQLRALPLGDPRAGEAAGLQAQYGTIFGRLVDLQLAKSQSSDALSIVQMAGVPQRPVTPDPPVDLGVALVLGLIGGILVAVLLGRMDGRLSSVDALTRAVGRSVVVSSPARIGDHPSFAVAQAALTARFPNATRMLVASVGPGLAAQEVARGLSQASQGGATTAGSGAPTRRRWAAAQGGSEATGLPANRQLDHAVEIVVIPNAAEADPSTLAATAPCEVSVLVAEAGVTTATQARLAARSLKSAGFQPTAAILLGNGR